MVGRTREVECLRNACTKREAQLVAVYGRRRVGKTYLVRETFGDKFAFSHTGLGRSDMAGQLIKFQESLERYGSPHADPAKDWIEAFRRLELRHHLLSPNDECISVGQAYIGGLRCAKL